MHDSKRLVKKQHGLKVFITWEMQGLSDGEGPTFKYVCTKNKFITSRTDYVEHVVLTIQISRRSPDQQGDTWATEICFLIIGTSLSESYTSDCIVHVCMSVCLWPLNINPKLNFCSTKCVKSTIAASTHATQMQHWLWVHWQWQLVKVCVCCALLSNSTESHEWPLTGTCNTTGATSNIKRREVLQLMPHELDFSFQTKTKAGKSYFFNISYKWTFLYLLYCLKEDNKC